MSGRRHTRSSIQCFPERRGARLILKVHSDLAKQFRRGLVSVFTTNEVTRICFFPNLVLQPVLRNPAPNLAF